MIRRRIEIEDVKRKQKEARVFNARLKWALLTLALVGTLISTGLFWNTWTRENQMIETRLETFTELRHSVIQRFLVSLSEETRLWSRESKITETAQAYFDIWEKMTPDERAHIREVYTNRKPIEAISTTVSAYNGLHDEVHPTLYEFYEHHGYYDIFFFNQRGDLVYSVEKEADFGLNFAEEGSVYADSGLGEAFQKASLLGIDKPATFVDFTAYAPSNGAPAAFFASPLINNRGEKIGVFAIQVPIDKFNAVMQYSSGLGSTGETYIVGPDYLMRSQSRLTKVESVLKHSVKTEAVKRVLAGKNILEYGHNYVGEKTIISGIPLAFNKTNWAVMTEMEIAELRAPLKNYIIFYCLSILFILGFSLLSYLLLFTRKAKV